MYHCNKKGKSKHSSFGSNLRNAKVPPMLPTWSCLETSLIQYVLYSFCAIILGPFSVKETLDHLDACFYWVMCSHSLSFRNWPTAHCELGHSNNVSGVSEQDHRHEFQTLETRWGLLDFMSVAFSSSSPLLVLLLNRDPRSTVFSVRLLPELNQDHPRPVFLAGPRWQIECQIKCQR